MNKKDKTTNAKENIIVSNLYSNKIYICIE